MAALRRLAVLLAGIAVTASVTIAPASAASPGTVQGRITDERGRPAAAQVSLERIDEPGSFSGSSGADGRYSIPGVPAGSYKLAISDQKHGTQWAHRKESAEAADPIRVRVGRVTTVNEKWLRLATLVVTVTDATTRRPVPGACVTLTSQLASGCAGANGVVTLTDLQPYPETAQVNDPAGGHFDATVENVALKRGTTRISVRLRPAASITATIRDAATAEPLSTCVKIRTAQDHGLLPACYNYSDADGKLVIGPIEPTTVQLFVQPQDGVHGAMWVTGTGGGTGDQRNARVVTATAGRPADVGTIDVGPAGAISGTVRDRVTGAPVAGTCVYPYAHDPQLGGDGRRCSTSTGAYTLTGLGAYDWPVEFTSAPFYGYAWQWSGDVADRFAARTVRVTAGATTTLDANMVPAGTLSGTVVDRAGQPVYSYIDVYNARTGDFAADSASGDTFQVKGLETQQVKIEHNGCWYGGTDFASATPVQVTAAADVRLDLVDCAP